MKHHINVVGDVTAIGWCVWVIVVLALAAILAREWKRTEQRGALVFLGSVFGFGLAGIAVLLAEL